MKVTYKRELTHLEDGRRGGQGRETVEWGMGRTPGNSVRLESILDSQEHGCLIIHHITLPNWSLIVASIPLVSYGPGGTDASD